MSTFWNSLHRVAQDQLFAGGYLAPRTAQAIAAKREREDATQKAPRADGKRLHWPRLAAPH